MAWGQFSRKNYHKILKSVDIWKIAVIIQKLEQCGFTTQFIICIQKMQTECQRV